MSTVAQKIPDGFGITLDTGARELRRGLWFGGQPARVMRLEPAAVEALDRLRVAPAHRPLERALARRLTDTGLAHPVPPALAGPADLTVVVPVHGRAAALDRCLASLGHRYPVVVVDDGSPDAAALATVADRHRAELVRLPVNSGPAAARNAGLAVVRTALVAFVDSDTEPGHDWVDALAAHLADPAVAAVAPRIVPRAGDGWAGRYTRARGTLDLGGAPARVLPYTRVSYLPTAALVARRAALLDVARDGAVFDPALRVGEDVDLVWRLVGAGHRVRYDPDVVVPHDEPRTWRALLGRRLRYGTSAAVLAQRHPDNLAPLVVHPWYTSAVAALLLRQPMLATAIAATSGVRLRRTLRRVDVPAEHVTQATAAALGLTFLGTSRVARQFALPLLLAGLGRRATRASCAALLLAPALWSWRANRHTLDPIRFTLAALADDAAYGAGVLAGCVRERTTLPLRPRRAR